MTLAVLLLRSSCLGESRLDVRAKDLTGCIGAVVPPESVVRTSCVGYPRVVCGLFVNGVPSNGCAIRGTILRGRGQWGGLDRDCLRRLGTGVDESLRVRGESRLTSYRIRVKQFPSCLEDQRSSIEGWHHWMASYVG